MKDENLLSVRLIKLFKVLINPTKGLKTGHGYKSRALFCYLSYDYKLDLVFNPRTGELKFIEIYDENYYFPTTIIAAIRMDRLTELPFYINFDPKIFIENEILTKYKLDG
jgi:hypothetical protein